MYGASAEYKLHVEAKVKFEEIRKEGYTFQ